MNNTNTLARAGVGAVLIGTGLAIMLSAMRACDCTDPATVSEGVPEAAVEETVES